MSDAGVVVKVVDVVDSVGVVVDSVGAVVESVRLIVVEADNVDSGRDVVVISTLFQ